MKKSSQMSFLYLKEIVGMKEGDTLSVSLSAGEDTPLLMPQVEIEEIYLQSVHALPDYKRMEMWERAARKEYAVPLGSSAPPSSPVFHGDLIFIIPCSRYINCVTIGINI